MLGASRTIEFREIGTAVDVAIRALPDEERAALLLTAVPDLTDAEVAVILDVSVQTLAARRAAAKDTLAHNLAKIGGLDPNASAVQDLIEAVVHRMANVTRRPVARATLFHRVRGGARALWEACVSRPAPVPVLVSAVGVVLLLVVVPGVIRRGNDLAQPVVEQSRNALTTMVAPVAPAPLLMSGESIVPRATLIALVVGNSQYAAMSTALTAPADASDVADALTRMGFVVEMVRDADASTMVAALEALAQRSAGADVAVAFYAGHGMTWAGENYLLPVDARFGGELPRAAVHLDGMVAATAGASLRVVILDACGNTPLQPPAPSNAAWCLGELREGRLATNTVVAYAVGRGNATGRNSVHTAALLPYLDRSLEVTEMFRLVQARMSETTEGRQWLYHTGALLNPLYLMGISAEAADDASQR